MRQILFLFLLSLSLLQPALSQRDYAREEFLIVSGGPALRKWEDYRVPADQHDGYGGNFAKAAHIRIQQLRRLHGDAAQITWMVYRPGHEARDREDAQRRPAWTCSMAEIAQRAASSGARLVWFSSKEAVISAINNRGGRQLGGLEFFVHSNKYAFLFDYSNDILGVSTCYLHVNDLSRLKHGLFAPNAIVQSWGCHTGEHMSRIFKKATGHAMLGAIGKTDYRAIGDNKSLPAVSGRWAE